MRLTLAMILAAAMLGVVPAMACHNPTSGGHYGLPCETQEYRQNRQPAYEPYRSPEPMQTPSGTVYEPPVYSSPPPTILEMYEKPYNDPFSRY